MRYQSTTGRDHAQIQELTTRIGQFLGPPATTGRPATLSVARSIMLTLTVLGHNLAHTVAADLFGVSQPTISRIFRCYLPLIGQVLCLHRGLCVRTRSSQIQSYQGLSACLPSVPRWPSIYSGRSC